MKRSVRGSSLVMGLSFCLVSAHTGLCQGYDVPLTVQGLDHTTLLSAASRAAGGITIGVQNDIALMFSNPASLQSLKEMQVSFGGYQQFSEASQVQQYAPLRQYPNFSLLMEGLTGLIPNPDTSRGTPSDTVWRPYDNIPPNWSRKKSEGLPTQAFFAAPVPGDARRLTFGFGVVEYANLTNYYQNNNVLSPSILSMRPSPFPKPTNVRPLEAGWFQYSRSREGSLRGIGGAVAASLSDQISVGLSGLVIEGTTDDYEEHTGRGKFTFYTDYLRLDSMYSHVVRTGTSDFNGAELTVSAMYVGQHVTLGFSARPPVKITRSFSGSRLVDTTGIPISTQEEWKDEVTLPWRGSVGVSIAVRENLRLAFEYEVRPYASAEYGGPFRSTENPWLSTSVFHAGLEYVAEPWVVLRAGVRGQAEVFEPEGNAIDEEPVRYSTYSAGCGFVFGPARLNVTYEYSRMKYQDVWGSAMSLNTDTRHILVADLAIEIPRSF